ncbi:MAG TPA: PP2C family protein-serine/threonine phosphatase [Acidimicrobiales bacterium]|nr:PP2C family protein-serine/threonine phosphatase [Acidimicrobiales bacterium]
MADNPSCQKRFSTPCCRATSPDIPGWSFATLYQPAGADLLVGGDFYDWYRRPIGGVALLVGDVSGKGSLAAALGMSIRKGLKALAYAGLEIEDAITVLEVALEEELVSTLVSFCYIELDAGADIRLVSVGHPPPWLIRTGRAREIDLYPNPLFGLRDTIVERPRAQSTTVSVAEGDLVLIFSDDLTEARLPDGRQFGEGALQSMLAEVAPGTRPWELALNLSTSLDTAVEPLRDDLVVLVLGRDGAAAERNGTAARPN